ncbi:hypothetical protein KC221_30605, partial [Mycobacterium tuberculosis]|nr:hypothetical protein [Mycobacterium tuberculosis]
QSPFTHPVVTGRRQDNAGLRERKPEIFRLHAPGSVSYGYRYQLDELVGQAMARGGYIDNGGQTAAMIEDGCNRAG